MKKLIIVSNRLPTTVREENGKLSLNRAWEVWLLDSVPWIRITKNAG